MLRAAYFGQELLSTFSTSIGEVALVPVTGGIFQVHLIYTSDSMDSQGQPQEVLLWDRKSEGGFPEAKILKQRVRNYIAPGKSLGHSDRPSTQQKTITDSHDESQLKAETHSEHEEPVSSTPCEDCM